MINELNALAQGVEASDGFTQHPVGTFNAVVEDIKQRTANTDGGPVPVWEVHCRSEVGVARYTIWGFTDVDVRRAQQEQEVRDAVLQKIGFTKRLFVDLGVWTKDQAKAAVWSGGEPSILGHMQHLIGRPCQLKVEPSKKKQGEVVIYVNAPVEGGHPVTQQYAQHQTGQQHANGGAQQQRQQSSVPAGQGSSLDKIPF